MIIRNSQYSLCDGIDARCTGNSVQNVSGTFDHSFRWHTFCCFFSRNIMELAVDVILNTFDDFNTWLSLALMLVAIFFRCFLYIIFYFFFLLFCSLFQRIERENKKCASIESCPNGKFKFIIHFNLYANPIQWIISH